MACDGGARDAQEGEETQVNDDLRRAEAARIWELVKAGDLTEEEAEARIDELEQAYLEYWEQEYEWRAGK